MTPEKKKLIEDPGYSYSTLAKFASVGRNISDEKRTPSYDMQLGKCFEEMIHYGPDDVQEFYVPAFESVSLINGILADEIPEPRYKKDGEVYANDTDLVDAIKEWQKKGGFPILPNDWANLKVMCKNMLSLELLGMTVADFLENAEFSVVYFWDVNGIRKKCEFDIISEVENDSGEKFIVAFDVKTAANHKSMQWMWQSHYWIQDRHYSEGLGQYAKEQDAQAMNALVFLTAYKDTGICQEVHIDPDNIERATDKYNELVYNYDQWVQSGKKPTGHLETRLMKVW